MEKWRCRGKNRNKVEINHGTTATQHSSTRLSTSNILSSEKKGKKWSIGGLLKRISKNDRPNTSDIDNILSNSSNSNNLDSNSTIQSHNDIIRNLSSNLSPETHNQPMKNEYHQKVINNIHVSEHECQDSSFNLYDTSMHSRNSESSSEAFRSIGGSNNRRNLVKARIKAKRERYCENSSSSDNEYHSNCSLAIIQCEENLQNMYRSDNNRRTRGARTERYMKRMYRDDSNGSNDQHKTIKNSTVEHPPLIKCKKKYSSDILSPYLWRRNDNLQMQLHRKTPLYYYRLFNNKHNYMQNSISSQNSKCSIDLHDNKSVCSDKYSRSLNRQCEIKPIADNNNRYLHAHIHTHEIKHKVQPPVPPPRSYKSHLYKTPSNCSTQNCDIENIYSNVYTGKCDDTQHYNNVNCNSLDRVYSRPRRNSNYQLYSPNETSSRYSFNGDSTFSMDSDTNNYVQAQNNHSHEVDNSCVEAPIVPNVKKTRKISLPSATINPNIELSISKHNRQEIERKRHSKNLEEALQELEVIYNSLHLNNDDDLLDRAEQRSMDEYRDKIAATAAVEESIKSSSDTSSSYEMSRELTWRHTTPFHQCHVNDTRLKDDMAYRRIHQNERSSSVDPNQMTLSQYSYLANSPTLSKIDDTHCNNMLNIDKPKSRRSTPDLMRDDVVFRTINHANNTLKIIEPQPPFGIPLGPVTTAVESDYLHIEPTKNSPRSLYIPQSEPDIITDDLAFRNLRKDTMKDGASHLSNMNFLPKIELLPEMKKKRAVRSLSADLYGIINKSNNWQHAWYKEYVKLNRPGRSSECSDDLSDNESKIHNSWMSNREYFDLDINGNRPKSAYQGRIQVCIPHHDENMYELSKTSADENEDASTPFSSSKINIQNANEVKIIEPFNENNELTEYKQLCHNLECLINKISEKAKCVDTKSSNNELKKGSPGNFIEWGEFFNKDDRTERRESVDKASDELFKSNIQNEIGIKQMVKEEKLDETRENDKAPCKLSGVHIESCDSHKIPLALINTASKKELKNGGNNFVIDINICTEFNLSNSVSYESSDITEVTSKSGDIDKKNISLTNNDDDDDDDSTTISIDLNEEKVAVEFEKTKDMMVLKSASTANDDCIDESSSIGEGREATL